MTTYKLLCSVNDTIIQQLIEIICKYINRSDIQTKHRKRWVGDNRRGVHIQLYAKSAGLVFFPVMNRIWRPVPWTES